MLKFKKITENNYSIIFESNNKKLGNLIKDVDGFFYWDYESANGLWTEHVLFEIAIKMAKLNETYNKYLNKILK